MAGAAWSASSVDVLWADHLRRRSDAASQERSALIPLGGPLVLGSPGACARRREGLVCVSGARANNYRIVAVRCIIVAVRSINVAVCSLIVAVCSMIVAVRSKSSRSVP